METQLPRGTLKRFREYLNAKYPFTDPVSTWRNNRFNQKSRAYGDYLYNQDREMFDDLLGRALDGRGECADFRNAP